MPKKNLFGYTLKALEEEMIARGEKKYRATQLYQWIYVKKVTDFDSMTDISKSVGSGAYIIEDSANAV